MGCQITYLIRVRLTIFLSDFYMGSVFAVFPPLSIPCITIITDVFGHSRSNHHTSKTIREHRMTLKLAGLQVSGARSINIADKYIFRESFGSKDPNPGCVHMCPSK